MQTPDAPAQKRKRGGQPGNTNRLRHGLYSRAHLKRRDEGRALRRKVRHLIVRLHMVARARKTLLRKRLRELPPQTGNAFDVCGFFPRRAPAFSIDCARIRGPT